MSETRGLTTPGSRLGIVVVIVLASVSLNLILFAFVGVLQGSDTTVYRSGAAHLLARQPLEGKEPSYVGYISVMAVCRMLGVGERGVVVLQIAVAAAAALALYRLGSRLCGANGGVAAAAFFILNVDVARWHVYLLTDSLYMSCVALTTWLVDRATRGSRWLYLAAGGAVLMTALLRPNGWLFVPLALGYWIHRTAWGRQLKWAATAGLLCVFATIMVHAGPSRRAIERERPDLALREGVIIWHFDTWRLLMPAEPQPESQSLMNSIGYGMRHPWATGRLAATRVAVELAHVRPFYSTAHNALVLAMLAFTYPLSVAALVRYRRDPVARLMAAVIGSDLLVVAATFADWDGRFLSHTFPLIGVFAGCGFVQWWQRVARRA